MKWLIRTLGVLAAAAILAGYGWLLLKGPWLLDGAHLRKQDLQPADGVIVTGLRTALVAVGAGIVAGLGLWYTHKAYAHEANRDTIEAAARDHGRESSDHGHWIYPGTELVIPTQ